MWEVWDRKYSSGDGSREPVEHVLWRCVPARRRATVYAVTESVCGTAHEPNGCRVYTTQRQAWAEIEEQFGRLRSTP